MRSLPALALSGCLALTANQAPPATYRINPIMESPRHFPMPAMALSIRTPSVPPGFETDRIALYMDDGRRFDYYAGGRWPAPLENMLQETVLRSAQSAWPTAAVTGPDAPTPDSYTLDTDIIDFQPVYSGTPDGIPVLHVKIRFTLRSQGNAMLDAFTLEKSALAASNSLTAIAAGLEALLQDILLQAFIRMELRLTNPDE